METARDSLVRRRNEILLDAILDAAEKLIREGSSQEFTMRALAEEAGVSVVTAYNHFGSKAGVMRGIIRRLIDEIRRRYFAAPIAKSVIDRILAMAEMGAQVSLEESQLYRTVGRSLMVFDEQMTLEGVRPESEKLWRDAMGQSWSDFRNDVAAEAARTLPTQLAMIYRGAFSFWIAGEIDDEGFRKAVRSGVATVLLAFVRDGKRDDLMAYMHD
jgi:AcrR family transcriptional regulator